MHGQYTVDPCVVSEKLTQSHKLDADLTKSVHIENEIKARYKYTP